MFGGESRMKSITIIQPFATLIALGEKQLETRSWATKHRGLLAIHAGKKIDKQICLQEPYKSVLFEYGYTSDNLPSGAVIAVCRMAECYQVEKDIDTHAYFTDGSIVDGNEYVFGDYSEGRYAWKLTDLVKLEEPISVKGMQGLWNFDYDLHIHDKHPFLD